jgi:type IV secretory pathway VirB10-like protein
LRQALPSHFEKAPNRPLYLRQIRQLLRAAGSSVDERSGFRGLLDLLHQAQREGWLRLHRDRKGVWRVFPAADSAAAVTPGTPAEVAVEAPPELEPELLMPVETDVNWEVEALPEEITEPAEPPPPAVIEEVVPVESTPQTKPRKPRAPRAAAKSGKRKTSTRRKSKEPSEASEEKTAEAGQSGDGAIGSSSHGKPSDAGN